MGMGCEVEEKGTQISEQNWGRSEPGLLEKRFQNISLLLASFKSLQSCPTLCDPMDCSPQAPHFIGILQARILEWVAIPFSRGSSWPRDWIHVSFVSCIGRQVLYHHRHLGSPTYNKAPDKPVLNILQNTCPVLLKNVKVLKNKESEQLSQPREAYEDMRTNCNTPGWDPK